MKRSFILYTDIYDCIKELPIEEKGNLLDAIFLYAIENKETSLMPETKMAFSFIKRTLDRDLEKWEVICKRNKGNIQKRWKKSNPQDIPDDTKNTSGKNGIPNAIDSVSDNDSDINKDLVSKQNPETPSLKENVPVPLAPKGSLTLEDFDKKLSLAEKLSNKKLEQERKQNGK